MIPPVKGGGVRVDRFTCGSSMIDDRHEQDWPVLRRRMIDDQIRPRGVCDPRVLDAMMSVPREVFVPPHLRLSAYEDRALPLAVGQTISQPFIVAYMTQQLAVEPHHRVLEIGTGSGYQCAILARLAAHVYTIERLDALRSTAAQTLAGLAIANVTLRDGDGSLGLAEFAPYDRILVTAAAPRIPPALVEQLVDHGRLVIPIGGPTEQTIVVVTRDGSRTTETSTLGCRFVKLIGKEGWRVDEATS
ncbi:MAG: protein-L-isoaspartate(D-aspartate) O-methyltransferase [Phycisphaerales bacterium]|nr:protein-L-isoaspartate(D-aspartate) O-methyltransferase [Phycisphaerales bacterium]